MGERPRASRSPRRRRTCSGSDLATGIQQAINMFNSSAYTSAAPAGTAKAIVISSDGESNASSNGQHPSSKYTDAQLNTLAQTTAAAAWAQGISVFVVFYYHGSDSGSRYDAVASPWCEGQRDLQRMTTDASEVPATLDALFKGNLTVTGWCSEPQGHGQSPLRSGARGEIMRNAMLATIAPRLVRRDAGCNRSILRDSVHTRLLPSARTARTSPSACGKRRRFPAKPSGSEQFSPPGKSDRSRHGGRRAGQWAERMFLAVLPRIFGTCPSGTRLSHRFGITNFTRRRWKSAARASAAVA